MTDEVLKAIGVDKLTVGWIVDEFDSSFDQLAMGSLRYHLYHSVASNEGEYGDKLKALLDDFEALKIRNRSLWDSEEWREHSEAEHPGDEFYGPLSCGDCSDFIRELTAREDEWLKEQAALRHRFIDILPGLWS